MFYRRKRLVFGLAALLILVLVFNLYFVWMIVDSSSKSNFKNSKSDIDANASKIALRKINNRKSKLTAIEFYEKNITDLRSKLSAKYYKQNPNYLNVLKGLLEELNVIEHADYKILNVLSEWPTHRQILPVNAPELGTIIELLRNARITKVDNAKHGTQLKLMLTFENGLKALFKPQWYDRHTKIDGLVYNGKDRHNAEVAAFHLSSLLSMRRVPVSFIRQINLIEIQKTATPDFMATMYQKGNTTCFYGVCHYCDISDPICGYNNVLEGSVITWLPSTFKLAKFRNPWQRTYSNRAATWETSYDYCDKVKQSKLYSLESSIRLLDLIDTAIFDFLIDNGDRHHYEVLQGNFKNPAVLLIDNGKSLGNPDIDHLDILAPLYQCCKIHKSTWENLQIFSGGSLSLSLKKLLHHNTVMADFLPLITQDHLNAIDRRLLTIFATVEYCLNKNKYSSNVIIDNKILMF